MKDILEAARNARPDHAMAPFSEFCMVCGKSMLEIKAKRLLCVELLQASASKTLASASKSSPDLDISFVRVPKPSGLQIKWYGVVRLPLSDGAIYQAICQRVLDYRTSDVLEGLELPPEPDPDGDDPDGDDYADRAEWKAR